MAAGQQKRIIFAISQEKSRRFSPCSIKIPQISGETGILIRTPRAGVKTSGF